MTMILITAYIVNVVRTVPLVLVVSRCLAPRLHQRHLRIVGILVDIVLLLILLLLLFLLLVTVAILLLLLVILLQVLMFAVI